MQQMQPCRLTASCGDGLIRQISWLPRAIMFRGRAVPGYITGDSRRFSEGRQCVALAAWRFSVTTRLDAIDRNILRELQDNGRITNVELARRVGISAPPCLRRGPRPQAGRFVVGDRAPPAAERLRSPGPGLSPRPPP